MSQSWIQLRTPLAAKNYRSLRVGDMVLLSGEILTARDKAHQRIADMIKADAPIPFDLHNQILYYTGPSPAPPGRIIGAAGPTTSSRMDGFTEVMLKLGVRGLIGKGRRDQIIRALLHDFHAVYFSTFGGAGAYLSMRIKKADVIAFPELGPEAVYRLAVEDFPIIVANDTEGADLYELAY